MSKHPFYSTEVFSDQDMFNSMYKKYGTFITVSEYLEIRAVFNYPPSLKDLASRNEYICPIKKKFDDPEIGDFSVVDGEVVYNEGSYDKELQAKSQAKVEETQKLLDQLPKKEGGLIKEILGYGKPKE